MLRLVRTECLFISCYHSQSEHTIGIGTECKRCNYDTIILIKSCSLSKSKLLIDPESQSEIKQIKLLALLP